MKDRYIEILQKREVMSKSKLSNHISNEPLHDISNQMNFAPSNDLAQSEHFPKPGH